MKHINHKRAILFKAIGTTFHSFKKQPVLLLPFCIFAFLELLTLILLYYFPRMPLKSLFGPPITTLWGERFLHYPLNFLLLPKLFSFARMALSIVAGSLLTAVAVAIVSDIYHKKHIKLKSVFLLALKKYPACFIVVFTFTVSFFFLSRFITTLLYRYFMSGHTRLLFLKAQLWLGPILYAFNFLLGVFIQAAFVYAIPALIIDNKKLLRSISLSVRVLKRNFISTIVIVGAPLLAYIPISLLSAKGAFLINQIFPEVILVIAAAGIVVASLVIDPIITACSAYIFLMDKEK